MATSRSEEQRRWEELGTDCLVQILSKLELDDMTVGVPFVCKAWLEASLDPQCWRVLDFRGLDLMPWSSFNARFRQTYGVNRFSFPGLLELLVERSQGSVAVIRFPSTFGATLQELLYASIKCPKLKVLGMPDLFKEDDKHIAELIGAWQELEFLELGRKPTTFVSILEQIALNCNNFKGLQVCGSIEIGDVLAIARHLPKLKRLKLSGSYLQKDGLLAIIDQCKELKELDVTHCRGFDIDDEILKRASCMESFDCEGAMLEDDCVCDYLYYEDVHWGVAF